MKYLITKSSDPTNDCVILDLNGAKNSILPLIIVKILVPGKTTFKNVPFGLIDLNKILEILKFLNIKIITRINEKELEIDNSSMLIPDNIPCSLTKWSRYSSLLLGILAKYHDDFFLGIPGGCEFENRRPLDIHYSILNSIGYLISEDNNYIHAHKQNNIDINELSFNLKFPSFGGTIAAIICYSSSKCRKITIKNCAIEPEIIDIADYLNSAGVKIVVNTNKKIITLYRKEDNINNVDEWKIIPDRIEAVTYITLSTMLGIKCIIKNVIIKNILSEFNVLKQTGLDLVYKSDSLFINHNFILDRFNPIYAVFEPFPGLATDNKPFFTILALFSSRKSILIDNVFSGRSNYTAELVKLGCKIVCKDKIIKVYSSEKFFINSSISCTDIRGGMANLILASYIVNKTNSEIKIDNAEQIMRGYIDIVNNFIKFGINIIQIE